MKYFVTFALGFMSFFNLFAETASANTDSAIQRTLVYAKGHQEFKNLFFKENEETFIRLVEKGQSPKTLFIGCSDSRVIPELISSFGPGELFVIRTAGNFVPYEDPSILWDGVAATIQYAVEVLGVSDVIVCGHSHCGAIEGLFKDIKMKTLANWLRFGHEAKQTTLEALGHHADDATKYGVAERVSVLYQLDHLMTYPYVKEKVNQKKLNLHGWHFTIETGMIEYYDPEISKFLPLNSVLEKAKT